MRRSRSIRARRSRRAAATTALLVAGGGLISFAPPASAAIVPANAAALATALQGPGADITGASYVNLANAGQNGVGDSTLSSFPRHGSTFAIMTSGLAASADDANTNVPDSGLETRRQVRRPGRRERPRQHRLRRLGAQGRPRRPSDGELPELRLPVLHRGVRRLRRRRFNDAFIAELDASTWDTSGSAITAPDNFAFDTSGNVVSVNAVGIGGFSLANAAGRRTTVRRRCSRLPSR